LSFWYDTWIFPIWEHCCKQKNCLHWNRIASSWVVHYICI